MVIRQKTSSLTRERLSVKDPHSRSRRNKRDPGRRTRGGVEEPRVWVMKKSGDKRSRLTAILAANPKIKTNPIKLANHISFGTKGHF